MRSAGSVQIHLIYVIVAERNGVSFVVSLFQTCRLNRSSFLWHLPNCTNNIHLAYLTDMLLFVVYVLQLYWPILLALLWSYNDPSGNELLININSSGGNNTTHRHFESNACSIAIKKKYFCQSFFPKTKKLFLYHIWVLSKTKHVYCWPNIINKYIYMNYISSL